jgi:hypothetical protein
MTMAGDCVETSFAGAGCAEVIWPGARTVALKTTKTPIDENIRQD